MPLGNDSLEIVHAKWRGTGLINDGERRWNFRLWLNSSYWFGWLTDWGSNPHKCKISALRHPALTELLWSAATWTKMMKITLKNSTLTWPLEMNPSFSSSFCAEVSFCQLFWPSFSLRLSRQLFNGDFDRTLYHNSLPSEKATHTALKRSIDTLALNQNQCIASTPVHMEASKIEWFFSTDNLSVTVLGYSIRLSIMVVEIKAQWYINHLSSTTVFWHWMNDLWSNWIVMARK